MEKPEASDIYNDMTRTFPVPKQFVATESSPQDAQTQHLQNHSSQSDLDVPKAEEYDPFKWSPPHSPTPDDLKGVVQMPDEPLVSDDSIALLDYIKYHDGLLHPRDILIGIKMRDNRALSAASLAYAESCRQLDRARSNNNLVISRLCMAFKTAIRNGMNVSSDVYQEHLRLSDLLHRYEWVSQCAYGVMLYALEQINPGSVITSVNADLLYGNSYVTLSQLESWTD